jgi:molybdenum cofactor cytidylyltransferase
LTKQNSEPEIKKRAKKLYRQHSDKTACIILAAGLSSRYGGRIKQLAILPFNCKSLVQNALDIANESKADYVFLVLGNHSSEILEQTKLGRAQLLLNKDYRKGLSTSIKAGISNLPNDCSSTVLMVADQPYLKPQLINRLVLTLKGKPHLKMACLAYKGEPRSPAIFSKEMFPALKKIKGDEGAKEILERARNSNHLILVKIQDPRIFFDVDAPSDLGQMGKRGSMVRSASKS